MASSSPQNHGRPQPTDARGLLIPDDIVKNRNYVRSDPVAFWSSYQFYIKVNDITKCINYLSAIPDRHFCLIKSLCLDSGFNDKPFQMKTGCFPNDKPIAQFIRLCSKILSRVPDLALKILQGDSGHYRPNNLQYSEGWEYDREVDDNIFWTSFKDQLRNRGHKTHHVKVIGIRKWKYDIKDMRERAHRIQARDQLLREITPDEMSDNESVETRTLDNMSDNESVETRTLDNMSDEQESDPFEEYENRIFKIDTDSKDFVWEELWQLCDSETLDPRYDMFLLWDPVRGHH